MQLGSLTPELVEVLRGCVVGKLNVLISGGTGVGKTTLLNVLSGFIPNHERIVTIEDAAELKLQQAHVVSLESRPANIEGQGEVRIRDLVRNALRMRPDRIIVGEVRGPETVDMLQAMNTGHDGSLTTIHANSPRDALSRLETLVLTAGVELPLRAIREQISSAFDVIIQISRLVDGTRLVTEVTEVLRMESDVVTIQDLFVAKPQQVAGAPLLDRPRPTGIRPRFLDKLAAQGVSLPPELFDPAAGDQRLAVVGGGGARDRRSRTRCRRAHVRRRTGLAHDAPAGARPSSPRPLRGWRRPRVVAARRVGGHARIEPCPLARFGREQPVRVRHLSRSGPRHSRIVCWPGCPGQPSG